MRGSIPHEGGMGRTRRSYAMAEPLWPADSAIQGDPPQGWGDQQILTDRFQDSERDGPKSIIAVRKFCSVHRHLLRRMVLALPVVRLARFSRAGNASPCRFGMSAGAGRTPASKHHKWVLTLLEPMRKVRTLCLKSSAFGHTMPRKRWRSDSHTMPGWRSDKLEH